MSPNANRKRSVIIQNKRTSVCLEDSFWHSLHAIVRIENTTIDAFIEAVKCETGPRNLSSGLRVAILDYFQRLAARHAGDGETRPHHADTSGVPAMRRSNRRARDQVIAFWRDVHEKAAAAAL